MMKRSEWIEIKQGVRHGCVLSPDLFSLYTELVMQELNELKGIKIGGKNVNYIRYADDIVLIAELQGTHDKFLTELSQ